MFIVQLLSVGGSLTLMMITHGRLAGFERSVLACTTEVGGTPPLSTTSAARSYKEPTSPLLRCSSSQLFRAVPAHTNSTLRSLLLFLLRLSASSESPYSSSSSSTSFRSQCTYSTLSSCESSLTHPTPDCPLPVLLLSITHFHFHYLLTT